MKKAFVVLGMHRSGTSSVAGVLALLGATPPKTLMGPADDNPKGFWESYAISELNDRILESFGSNWCDHRSVPTGQAERFIEEGVDVLRAEFGDAPTLVLKDPRICRLYPYWDEVLRQADYAATILLPVRHPAEVQASLTHRNGLLAEDAVRLWLRHVLDAEKFSRGLDRVWISWPEFLTNWRRQLALLEGGMSLQLHDPWIGEQIDAFLSPDLQHHRRHIENERFSLEVQVFATLTALSREG
jgi:hypothetical protein